jgi:hypothetical protein
MIRLYMTSKWTLCFGLCAILLLPSLSLARQRFELTGRLGFTNIGVLGSGEKDTAGNPGAGIEWRVISRISVEFEVDRTIGLNPRPVPCGLDVPCIGFAEEGVRTVTHFSGNALYYFASSGAVQPYVLAGVGALHSRSAKAITFVRGTFAEIVQQPDEKDRGVSIGFGAGLRIPLGVHFSVRPELRFYDASITSRSNLSMVQGAVGLGYQW